MIYDNTMVRRQDRLLDEPRAWELLQKGEYGLLSLVDLQGNPYGIPINYVWDGHDHIYLHCAPEGKKLNSIKLHREASFCVVGRTHVVVRQVYDRLREYSCQVSGTNRTLGR